MRLDMPNGNKEIRGLHVIFQKARYILLTMPPTWIYMYHSLIIFMNAGIS